MKRKFSFFMSLIIAFGLISIPVYASDQTVYTVVSGDTLWRIASAHDTTWQELAEYNNLGNPHLIFPGQEIAIPGAGQAQIVVIEPIQETLPLYYPVEPPAQELEIEVDLPEEPYFTIELTPIPYQELADISDVDFDIIVTRFMDKFTYGDISSAYQMMSELLKSMVDEQTLEGAHQLWFMTQGSFIDHSIVYAQELYGFMIYNVLATHTMGTAMYSITLTAAGEIEGFANLSFAFDPAIAYEDAEYLVEPIIIGESTNWQLDGLLTLPFDASEDNPVPAIVLVHGSGPGNMDQSIFDNRPFFDIANYLSSNGIAVVRYNKRTFSHGIELMQTFGGGLTLWEETIEDAILAAELLRNDPRIDENRVFLVGLSLGAVTAPRIQNAGGNFNGLIMLAGSPRLIEDVLLEQLSAAANLMEDGVERDILLVEVESLEEALSAIDDIPDYLAREIFISGMSVYYLRDMAAYRFADEAENIDVPFLVMQGGRDFQVLADVDFIMLMFNYIVV